jgi:hypothetical protein
VITEAIVWALLQAAKGLLWALPDWEPVNLSQFYANFHPLDNYQQVRDGLAFFDQYVPVTDLLVILGLMLSTYSAYLVFRAVSWLLTKAHILGGSGD